MSTVTIYNVQQYGAMGIARPAETMTLQNLEYAWLRYPPGITETVYGRESTDQPLDSVGIQRAIDAAHHAGGGTVWIPGGDYLIAPIQVKSNVRLHLDNGATLYGSPELKEYLFVPGNEIEYELDNAFGRRDRGFHKYARLISAAHAENISLTGSGTINCQSHRWVIPWLNSYPDYWIVERPTDSILFEHCHRVHVEGIRLLHTPSWSLVFHQCRHIRVSGVTIRSFDVINSDGIDLVDSSHATIADCNLHVTDDGICLKSLHPDRGVRNVAVTNCIVRTLCNGFKIGTDSTGDFEDISVSNLVLHNPSGPEKGAEGGINLCAYDGGRINNITISNITMRNVECPFYLLATDRERQQKHFRQPRPGLMERVSISNIRADGAGLTSFLVGHPEQPLRDIYLDNINVCRTEGFCTASPTGPVGPVKGYPTPYIFGDRQTGDGLPAYGLYARDVAGLTITNMHTTCTGHDVRPDRVLGDNVTSIPPINGMHPVS